MVEDSEDDVFIFRHILRKCNSAAFLTVINDGKTAVAHLADATSRPKYDMVFLDLRLPIISGIEVLARFHSAKYEFPIYILTGSANSKDKEKVSELGAAGYFEKPLPASVLRNILSSLQVRGPSIGFPSSPSLAWGEPPSRDCALNRELLGRPCDLKSGIQDSVQIIKR